MLYSQFIHFLCIILSSFYHRADSYRSYQGPGNNYNLYRAYYGEPKISMNRTTVEQISCRVFGFCPSNFYKHRRSSKFKSIFEWKQMEFDYPSKSDRMYDIETKTFIPGNGAPIDVDVYYAPDGNRTVFMTIPRFLDGIPATLGTICASQSTGRPVIKPYPSWNWHRYPEKCGVDRLVSVYRVKIDNCGRLWVLDTGRLLSKQICPMQILAFDLRTNQLIHRNTIPQSLLRPISILVTPIVEVSDNYCSDTYIYIADCQSFSIIVHHPDSGAFWRIPDKTMYPNVKYGTFNIQGDQFDLMDGVLGMDLGPNIPGQGRKLYYHALSAVTENWALTKHLRNRTLFEKYPDIHTKIFHTYDGTRQSQSPAQAIDKHGIAYFGQLSETAMSCWNTATEYGPANIDVIEYNPNMLQFPSGVKIINNPRGHQELWILTSRLQKVITGSIKPEDTNFRILAVKVEDALSGTKCKDTFQGGGEHIPRKNKNGKCYGYGCDARFPRPLFNRLY